MIIQLRIFRYLDAMKAYYLQVCFPRLDNLHGFLK